MYITHTLRSDGFDASEDGTGRGTPLVAFHGSQDPDASGDVTHSVGRNQGQETCIAFTERSRSEGRNFEYHVDLAYALTNPGSGGATHSRKIMDALSGVRRLMPRECERLQGLPDDYTLVPWRGNPAADGPRYKAIGNGMAVPCIGWVLARVNEALLKSAKTLRAPAKSLSRYFEEHLLG
jgi:DNA (cytosine-5)-methyltransferase 1